MHFEIKANCRRGLRIIPEIPHYPIVRIEGYNGLGKSSAIRLLELCTGRQPFENQPHLWTTFKDHLQNARITVRHLHGAESITWNISNTASWPDAAEPLREQIGTIEIDGTSATFVDVESLLSVHRIDGREQFRHAVAQQAQATATLVGEQLGPNSDITNRQHRLDEILANLEDLIPSEGVSQFIATRREQREATARVQRLQKELEDAIRHEEKLRYAATLANQLEDVRDRGPNLADMIADLQRQMSDSRSKMGSLDKQLEDAATREQKYNQANKEFDLANKHYSRCHAGYIQAQRSLIEAASRAGLEPTKEAIQAGHEETAQTLESLVELLPMIHSTPRIIEILRSLSRILAGAEGEGLSEEKLINDDTRRTTWTVHDLREALDHAAAIRDAERAPKNAQDLQEEIEKARQRLRSVTVAKEASVAFETAKERLDSAEQRLHKSTSALPEDTARTASDILKTRRSIEENVRSLTIRLEHANQAWSALTGGKTERQLIVAFNTACRDADVSPSRVATQLGKAEELVTDLQGKVASARQIEQQATSGLHAQIEGSKAAFIKIHERGHLAWLRQVLSNRLPTVEADTERQLNFLARLAEAVDKARDRLSATTQDLFGVSGALADLADELRGKAKTPNEWTLAARTWTERQVAEWLNQSGVREALFPAGEHIAVDLANMMVTWADIASRQRQARPFDGFSSGEQAVAYTQARLNLLDYDSRLPNRLIALDEFGAFADARRMAELQRALVDRSERFPNDQIVLILPLSAARYAAESAANSTSGERRDLEAVGYIAEEITR